MGDFRGLMEKLDYLQELGITAIWLLPFYPSPLRDDGYDIADYFDVNPKYGTLDDFRNFLNAARSEEHTSELQSLAYLVCRLLLEKKKTISTISQSIVHVYMT